MRMFTSGFIYAHRNSAYTNHDIKLNSPIWFGISSEILLVNLPYKALRAPQWGSFYHRKYILIVFWTAHHHWQTEYMMKEIEHIRFGALDRCDVYISFIRTVELEKWKRALNKPIRCNLLLKIPQMNLNSISLYCSPEMLCRAFILVCEYALVCVCACVWMCYLRRIFLTNEKLHSIFRLKHTWNLMKNFLCFVRF